MIDDNGQNNASELHTGAAQAGQPEGTQPEQGLGSGGSSGSGTSGTNAGRTQLPPPIPIIAHEDHVRVLVKEAHADEVAKFAGNRAQVEKVNDDQNKIAGVMEKAVAVIAYPQMDFSPNDKARAEAKKAADPNALKQDIEAHKKFRKERDQVRQKAGQGAVAVEG